MILKLTTNEKKTEIWVNLQQVVQITTITGRLPFNGINHDQWRGDIRPRETRGHRELDDQNPLTPAGSQWQRS